MAVLCTRKYLVWSIGHWGHLQLFIKYFLRCVIILCDIFPACIYVYYVHAWYPLKQKKWSEPLEGVKDCCEQPHVYLGPARAAAKLSLSLLAFSVLISASKSICPSSQAPQSLQDREVTSGLSRAMLMRMTLTSWEQHSDLLTQTKGEKLGQHI